MATSHRKVSAIHTLLSQPRRFSKASGIALLLRRRWLRVIALFIVCVQVILVVRARGSSEECHTWRSLNQRGGSTAPSWKIQSPDDEAPPADEITSNREHVFELGQPFDDYVTIYKPLCVDTTNNKGQAYTIDGDIRCDRYKGKSDCKDMRIRARREQLLNMSMEAKPADWIVKNQGDIAWVNGLTFIQAMDAKSTSISHYVSRILFLYHMVNNIESYTPPPYFSKHILIVPHSSVYERFANQEKYNFYHMHFLETLLSPNKVRVGQFSDFVSHVESVEKVGIQHDEEETSVHVVNDLSLPRDKKRYVCFNRTVVPAILNSRFFVNDFEYPSPPSPTSLSWSLTGESFLSITPSDSWALRQRMDSVLQVQTQQPVPKRMIFIDPKDRAHSFSPFDHHRLVKKLETIAYQMGHTFEVVDFTDMTFAQQYRAMRNVRLAVGVHGKTLVNSIFMPPLATLFEIFPFGFSHPVFQHGGNAGLRYESYVLSTGKDFATLAKYKSRKQCIEESNECKMHYRDASLVLRSKDLSAIAIDVRRALNIYERSPNKMMCNRDLVSILADTRI